MRKFIAIVLLITFTMSGCAAGFNPADMTSRTVVGKDGTVMRYDAPGSLSAGDLEVVNGCREFKLKQLEQSDKIVDKMSADHAVFAYMHRETMQMITNTFGKGGDDCRPGTTMWEAYSRDVGARQKTLQKVSDGFFDIAKWGIIGWVAGKVLGSVGDKYSFGDNGTMSGKNTLSPGRDGIMNLTPSSTGSVYRDYITK